MAFFSRLRRHVLQVFSHKRFQRYEQGGLFYLAIIEGFVGATMPLSVGVSSSGEEEEFFTCPQAAASSETRPSGLWQCALCEKPQPKNAPKRWYRGRAFDEDCEKGLRSRRRCLSDTAGAIDADAEKFQLDFPAWRLDALPWAGGGNRVQARAALRERTRTVVEKVDVTDNSTLRDVAEMTKEAYITLMKNTRGWERARAAEDFEAKWDADGFSNSDHEMCIDVKMPKVKRSTKGKQTRNVRQRIIEDAAPTASPGGAAGPRSTFGADSAPCSSPRQGPPGGESSANPAASPPASERGGHGDCDGPDSGGAPASSSGKLVEKGGGGGGRWRSRRPTRGSSS